MGVFRKFTRASLRRNRVRTIVTIIGIVLSMALFTAVIEGAYSGLQFLVRSETESVGAFHGYYYNMSDEEANQIRTSDQVKDSASWDRVGWAKVDSLNRYKPYLLINSVSDNFTDLVSVHITKGAMPQNGDEIILPEDYLTDAKDPVGVGDSVTLEVGRRVLEGYELDTTNPYEENSSEEIIDAQQKTYTVVGIYRRFNNAVVDYSTPAFVALTRGAGTGNHTLFFTLKSISKFHDYAAVSPYGDRLMIHSELLRLNGSFSNSVFARALYSLAAILVILIAFGSVSLIYNSFSISLSERTKQFGILKSVGATRRQIRHAVYYEALLLSCIGIPIGLAVGCAGIGITLWALRDAFATLAFSGASTETKMQLVLNPVALLIAVAVCLVTTLISAYIPAKRAIRLNAIDSIRQSGDIKISRKKVRTSGLTQKLFGFEGMIASKNFKRNKKRYRSTVISLFLSIVLFISASSFSSYLNSLFAGVSSDESFVDIEYYTVPDSESDPAKVMSLLSGADGLTDSVFYSSISVEADFDKSSLDRSYPLDKISAAVLFVNDDRFEKLCRDNGIDPSACFDKSSPSAVVYNHEVLFTEIDGKSKRQNYTVLNESSFPAKGTFATARQIDGFVLFSVGQDDNGDEIYTYYPADYMDSLETGNNGFSLDDLDQSKAKVLSAKEAETVSEINIAASLRECPFFIPSGSFTIFYPDSVKTAVLTEDRLSELYQTDYSFLSDSHSKTFSEMTQILKDNRMDNSRLRDVAADKESFRMIKTVLDVFSYGFIILISLISMANVFNTISTGISLRRREFAMLRSVGMSQKSFRRMMNYECIIYGLRSLLWGLPASVLVTYAIYKAVSITYLSGFYIPWYSIVIAVLSVFVVVFATMLYSTAKIRKENPIDALRTENL